MKKLLTVCLILFVCVSFSYAMEEAVNTTINSSTWTAVTIDTGTVCYAYVFQSRDGSDFKIKKTASSTAYFTVRDGATAGHEMKNRVQGLTLFYAQSVSGEVVIEVLPVNK